MGLSLLLCVSTVLLVLSSVILAQPDDSSFLPSLANQEHRRSLMPWTAFHDEATWLAAVGMPSWNVDFEGIVNADFGAQDLDVYGHHGGGGSGGSILVFSLKTEGDISSSAPENYKINDGQARMRVGNLSPIVTMTFQQPVKAWGATFESADNGGDTDLDIVVICPGGDNIVLEANDGFTGFVLQSQSASSIIFKRKATGNGLNTIWIDDVVAVSGMKKGGSNGDPHFQTWSGQWYDFHGICDLVLLQDKNFANGLGLTIHIRTKGRWQYAYIETAAVQIGDDTLQVSSFGDYMLDGISNAQMPAAMGDGQFWVDHQQKNDKQHEFVIRTGSSDQEAIKISTFKDMVAVAIENATPESFGSSVGMMGKFEDGSLVARDGITVMEDLNQFGQEWQVLASEPLLFQTPSIFLGKPCVPRSTMGRRRLGEAIAREDAEVACAHHEDEEIRDMCIFDVIAMDDLEVANAHGAF